MDFVLTAHPTQATRRTLLQKYAQVLAMLCLLYPPCSIYANAATCTCVCVRVCMCIHSLMQLAKLLGTRDRPDRTERDKAWIDESIKRGVQACWRTNTVGAVMLCADDMYVCVCVRACTCVRVCVAGVCHADPAV